MSMNRSDEGFDNDATLRRGHILPERVDSFGENIVTMNGDVEEGTHGQLYICHQEEDTNPTRQRERKRSVHNSMEKKRKEKIRFFINKIGELLPPIDNPEKEKIGRSTLDIVEKAYEYIQELKLTTSRLLEGNTDDVQAEEIGKLKLELETVKKERDKYVEQLQQTGNAVMSGPQGQWSQKDGLQDPAGGLNNVSLNGLNAPVGMTETNTPSQVTECGDNKAKSAKKKRNTISLQLEMKKQQQPMELSAPGVVGNFGNMAMNNMVMNNAMMNQMIMGGNQMMMQNQLVQGQGQNQGQSSNAGQGQNTESNAAEMAGAGLLQLAMQDAGITPNTHSQCASSDENVPSSVPNSSIATDSVTVATENSALETLASVATVPQGSGVVGSSAPVSQAAASPLVSQSGSAMTATTQAINANMPIMATGQSGMGQMPPNSAMMNMPFMNNGQQFLQGQQGGFNAGIAAPQQQIMFINEQGVPCIANVPLGIDPNSLGIQNFQKQMMNVDKSGNMGLQGFGNMMLQKDQGMPTDQTLIANMNLQGQQTFQQTQNAVAMGTAGTIVQQSINSQLSLNQPVMQPMHAQMPGGLGNQGQQGLIMPVSQSGNLLINPANQSQAPPGNQLPQALLLPNGQIIPVVTNPQVQSSAVNGGGAVIQTNTQWQGGGLQQQQAGATQGAITVSGAPTRMSLPPGIQAGIVPAGMDGNTVLPGGPSAGPVPSSSAQIGQPQVTYSQQSSGLGLLMTTASNLPGTNAVANTSVSQPLSEASHSVSDNDLSGNNVTKKLDASAAAMGGVIQQGGNGMTDNKQSGLVRFSESDMADISANPGSQVIMRSTGSSMAFSSASGSEGMMMSSTTMPPGNAGMPVGVNVPQSANVGTGANGPILLTMNINGQPTSVLVDPTTMTVLGTVPNPQQAMQPQPPQPQAMGQQVAGQQVQGQQVTGQAVQVTPPGNNAAPNKKTKKNSQRAICPKPSANRSKGGIENALFGNEETDQSETVVQPTNTTKKSKSKSKSKAAKPAAAPMENVSVDGNTADTTDILAKAAESIFSSEISPQIGGFYNPANEDNPLQIDTSAGETEEDADKTSSPRKDPNKHSSGTIETSSQMRELHSQGDSADVLGSSQPLSEQMVSNMIDSNIISSRGPGDKVSNVASTTPVLSGGEGFGVEKTFTSSNSNVFSPPSVVDPPKKSSKRSKKTEKDKSAMNDKAKETPQTEDEIENTVKEIINSVKNNTPPPPPKKTGKKSAKKQSVVEKSAALKSADNTDTEPVIEFPETLIFSEKEISDVLDQVENLGSSLSDSSQTVTPPKKNKSKKNKSDQSNEGEPAPKKQKKNSSRDKSKSLSGGDNSSGNNKSSLSVYDFDEDGPDEFSSPLRSLQTKRNSSSTLQQGSANELSKSASSANVSPVRAGGNSPFSSRSSANDGGRLFPIQNQMNFMSSPQDSTSGFIDDPLSERPLFDTRPPPAKEKKSKKRSKSKKNKSELSTTVSSLSESNVLESQKVNDTDTNKPVDSGQSVSASDQFDRTNFDQFESNSEKKDESEIAKMDIDLLEKSPVESMDKKDSVEFDVRTRGDSTGLLSCDQESVITQHRQASIAEHNSPSQQAALTDPVSLTEPVHISTNSLASSENSDIDNTMNSILGLSAAALSPHIMHVSPGQQQPPSTSVSSQMRVRSPQLQTPKSTSPVSMASPQQQNLHHSVLMSVASSGQIVSRASPITSCSAMTNFSSPGDLPYSAESLFNSPNEKTPISAVSKPTSLAISRSDSDKTNHSLFEKSPLGSKARSGIYSADNFVQTNKGGTLPSEKSTNQVNVISPPLSSSLNRIGNDNSSDGFNFASIGLNLSTPTTSANSIIDSLSMSPIISTIPSSSVTTTSSFTFTLSSVTSTSTTSSASMTTHDNHQNVHPFPFYSPQSQHHLSSSASSASSNMQSVSNLMSNSNQQEQQQQQPPLSMPNFDLDLGNGVGQHMGHQQKRPSNDSVPPHIQSSQGQLFYGMSGGGNRSSCSVQNQQREPQEQPPMIPNITVSSHNAINKSQSEQIHNTHKRMQELSQSSGRGGPQQVKANNPDPRGNDISSMERQFTMKSSNPEHRGSEISSMDRQFNIKSSNQEHRGNELGSIDRQFSMKSSNPDHRGNDMVSMERQQFSANNLQPFFSPPNFSNASSQSMSTHPLRHPPLNSVEERSGMGGTRSYEPIFSPHSQGFNPTSQSFGGSRYDSNVMFPHQRDSGVGGGSQPLSHTPPSQTDGRKSANSQSSSAKANKQTSAQPPQHSVNQQPQQQTRAMSGPPPHTGPTPPHHAPSHRPTPPQAGTQPPPPHQSQVSHSRAQKSSSASRSKQSQKKNKQQQQQQQLYGEMESPFPHAMFEANRSLTPFFGLPPQNLSPPARNMQNEAPGLFAGNLFGAGPRHTATASMPKNAEISAPFNSLFPPGRPQNGLGLNFQPGFGMNSVHGAMSNAPSITPHSGSVTVTPHMSNFSLTNIFSDVNNSSQNDSLNISPIKFPHSNPMLPHQGMDPNSLQHPHHQGGSIYHPHNRSHPPPPVLHNAMSINSILGQHHHSFDGRGVPQGMNTSVAPPFHGAGHPPSFAMPPLNFSMHDP